jgi:hypothetical protein
MGNVFFFFNQPFYKKSHVGTRPAHAGEGKNKYIFVVDKFL